MNITAYTLAALLAMPAGASAAAGQEPKPAQRPRQPARSTMTITVTDLEGKTIPGVWVKASGAVDREAPTDESGTVTFRNMNTGTYRLRFEHDEFVTLEREVAQTAKPLPVNVSLNAAPPKPAPAPAQPEAPPTSELPPAGPPTSVSIPDFFEKNYLGSAPSQTSEVGCVPGMTTQLIQLRDPLGEHRHENVDELLYVVGGDGTHRIGGRDVPLEAGVLATVPRGTPHAITRRGRNPLVILSITTQPCSVK